MTIRMPVAPPRPKHGSVRLTDAEWPELRPIMQAVLDLLHPEDALRFKQTCVQRGIVRICNVKPLDGYADVVALARLIKKMIDDHVEPNLFPEETSHVERAQGEMQRALGLDLDAARVPAKRVEG
jgi:hypothetical protein